MGRKSTKENKNIYQISRENAGLTREAAAELLHFISSDRIEKIESERSLPHPEEILAMSEVYKNPSLHNQYCSMICPIGQKYVHPIESKQLSQITLEMIAAINALTKEKDRLVEITVDGTISPEEIEDFKRIKEQLEKMALTIDSLKLWIDDTVISGQLSDNIL